MYEGAMDLDGLLELETAVWNALCRGDAEADAGLLAEDFLGVLLCYRADWHRVDEGSRGEAESMYISSLWSRRSGRWVNVFSQDSPAENRLREQGR